MNLLHRDNKRPIFVLKVGPDLYSAYYTDDLFNRSYFEYKPTKEELAKAEAELAKRDQRS